MSWVLRNYNICILGELYITPFIHTCDNYLPDTVTFVNELSKHQLNTTAKMSSGGKCGFLLLEIHDDVIKWKLFPRNCPLCGEFTGPGEFPTQRPVTRSFGVFFDLRLNNRWVNNREAGGLRRHRGHYDVNVMFGGFTHTYWFEHQRRFIPCNYRLLEYIENIRKFLYGLRLFNGTYLTLSTNHLLPETTFVASEINFDKFCRV